MRLLASVMGTLLLASGVAVSTTPAFAKPQTAQSKACSDEADHQGWHGKDRTRFRASCLKGALAPKTPTAPTGPGREANAVTKPSGADRTTRSQQCSDEADRRKLATSEREAFRMSCLASAAPVAHTGTKEKPTPSPAIPKLGTTAADAPH
ncbi:MAG: hypothetical protein ACYDD1_13230 [Caulobacteraceae bacterium]